MSDLYEDLDYNEQRKKAELIIRHSFCEKKLSILRERLENIGCEVPEEGFSSHEELQEWRDSFEKKTSEPDHRKRYEKNVRAVTAGQDEWGPKTQEQVEKVRKSFYPLPGQIFREIMRRFNTNPEYDQEWRKFFRNYFFMNKKVYPYPYFRIRNTVDDESGKEKLYVRIFGHTRKENICGNWNSIKQAQKELDSFTGKTDPFEKLDKKMDAFEIYKELEENNPKMQKTELYVKTAVRLENDYEEVDAGDVQNKVLEVKNLLEDN